MGVSKAVYNGKTLIDLTSDTVTETKLLSGYTAHKADGTIINGGITTKQAATYIPGTTDQVFAEDEYLYGNIVLKGDANLLAENIKAGVSIFGVTGTYGGTNFGEIKRRDIDLQLSYSAPSYVYSRQQVASIDDDYLVFPNREIAINSSFTVNSINGRFTFDPKTFTKGLSKTGYAAFISDTKYSGGYCFTLFNTSLTKTNRYVSSMTAYEKTVTYFESGGYFVSCIRYGNSAIKMFLINDSGTLTNMSYDTMISQIKNDPVGLITTSDGEYLLAYFEMKTSSAFSGLVLYYFDSSFTITGQTIPYFEELSDVNITVNFIAANNSDYSIIAETKRFNKIYCCTDDVTFIQMTSLPAPYNPSNTYPQANVVDYSNIITGIGGFMICAETSLTSNTTDYNMDYKAYNRYYSEFASGKVVIYNPRLTQSYSYDDISVPRYGMIYGTMGNNVFLLLGGTNNDSPSSIGNDSLGTFNNKYKNVDIYYIDYGEE